MTDNIRLQVYNIKLQVFRENVGNVSGLVLSKSTLDTQTTSYKRKRLINWNSSKLQTLFPKDSKQESKQQIIRKDKKRFANDLSNKRLVS